MENITDTGITSTNINPNLMEGGGGGGGVDGGYTCCRHHGGHNRIFLG